ncbi:porin [Massilia aurea]|uniref:porin n=1 Tax=Massilia aurea TaxID=373040 RepID=UPI003462E5D0
MKTSTNTIILLGLLAGSVQAQTTLGLYGIVDAGIVGERGGTASTTKVTSGAAAASRIGIKGNEELGDGMAAFFILESGVRIDTGELDAQNTLFNRQALVGLKTRVGSVTVGRQYTPWHATLAAVADPFATGYAGTSKNLFPDSGSNVRTSNTVMVASPVIGGVSADLAYSAGERSIDSAAGRQYGGSVGYAAGPLVVRLAYNNRNTDLPAVAGEAAAWATGRNTLLAATYVVKGVKLHAGYGIDKGYNAAPIPNANNPFGGVKPTASTDGRSALLGATAPLGGGTLLFSVMHKDDKTAFNQDASAWGVGYLYHLSRRTGLYAAYAHVNNKNGAGYTVNNNSETGSGDTGYNLGLRHTF